MTSATLCSASTTRFSTSSSKLTHSRASWSSASPQQHSVLLDTHTHRRTRPTHTHTAGNSMSRQVDVQLPTYADDVALPASLARRRRCSASCSKRSLSDACRAHSSKPAPDGRTDVRQMHRPDMELGHWVTGSMGHLSRPANRVIILTRYDTRVFPVFEKKPKIKI